MTPKRTALDQHHSAPRGEQQRSALRDIIDRSEEIVSVFVEELTGSGNLREELEKTVRRATRARKTVDRNLEALLGALNLPTRRDYAKLIEEIHSLQGAITNLNMKMDRLIASSAPHRDTTHERFNETLGKHERREAGESERGETPVVAVAKKKRRYEGAAAAAEVSGKDEPRARSKRSKSKPSQKSAKQKPAVKKRKRRASPGGTAHG